MAGPSVCSKKLVILPTMLQGGLEEPAGLSTPPPISILAGPPTAGADGTTNVAPAVGEGATPPRSPTIAVTKASPMGGRQLEEQRHKLMADMQEMQSRLLGEQRVLQSMLQEHADKVRRAD